MDSKQDTTQSPSNPNPTFPGPEDVPVVGALVDAVNEVTKTMLSVRPLRVYKIDEGGGCVYHWVAARDESMARGIVVGAALQSGTQEDSSDVEEWGCTEVSIEDARATRLSDCEPEHINMWEACLAADGPEYLACSEW